MTHTRETPVGLDGGPQQTGSATGTYGLQITRMGRVTQLDQVREMLSRWVCATEFLEAYIPRYGARIYDLRREGYVILRRECIKHYHQSHQYQWRIAAVPIGRRPVKP